MNLQNIDLVEIRSLDESGAVVETVDELTGEIIPLKPARRATIADGIEEFAAIGSRGLLMPHGMGQWEVVSLDVPG